MATRLIDTHFTNPGAWNRASMLPCVPTIAVEQAGRGCEFALAARCVS